MIGKFFPHLVRQYAYGFTEAACVALFSFASPVILFDRTYRAQIGDPGMAKATAGAIMLISISLFILTVCVKKIDVER